MIRRWGIWGALVAVLVVVLGVGYRVRRAQGETPLSISGPNILANNDFSLNVDADKQLPDGWTGGTTGVALSDSSYDGRGRSVQIQGINNYLKSPFIAARPGAEYRVAFRALSDVSATKVRVFFHWRDGEGIDRAIEPQPWQDVPVQSWNTISAAATAPDYATQVAISIHPAADAVVFVDDLTMGQLGVRVAPWPNGKRAALAFSFDYETAMGGLIHSRSVGDPNAGDDYLQRARRMRAGAEQALELFAPAEIRATFYTNGYNFLTGNVERRLFMGNPIYAWASTEPGHGWLSDRWKTTPWFADDPYQTEVGAPEWYFGTQIGTLQRARQDIQSHTFAHFAGTYVTAADWRADFEAWKQVAGDRGVAPATSLAFPWSSSAGMSYASWDVLVREGIRSITRTTVGEGQRRSWIADRAHFALRQLPSHPQLSVIADVYLTPDSTDEVAQQMQTALLNEGAIDVWAHTEEVTSVAQIEAWRATIEAALRDFWIAPVPELVQYAHDVREVSVHVRAEQPSYSFTVRNGSKRALHGLTLTLPFEPERVEVDGAAATVSGTTLILDLQGSQARKVTLYPAANQAPPATTTLAGGRWGL